ncbi:30S ribosome-binding factor RbfA [Spiroplasma chrysopicola]|uniref:Ribosome-binding factor A n=1 Tax=Spiroplasma chrysopicola DF-1 TaxID=1276227 RepID=R4UGE0_9MOLU|nr:30S ribosome-binding factor RbfA [Spiroplasma chrysopicola]AGM25175.1 ribosome-binding factor A [Spiroplasma chrysopicola DF-1]
MKNSVKVERMQSIIVREITLIMQREIKEPLINQIIIHDVKLTSDLGYAKVYYSLLLEQKQEEVESVLESYRKEIRSKLSKKLDIYKCPELEFIYDNTLANANRINDILDKIKQ